MKLLPPRAVGGASLKTFHADLQPPSKAQLKMGVKLCLFNNKLVSAFLAAPGTPTKQNLCLEILELVPRETQRQIGT